MKKVLIIFVLIISLIAGLMIGRGNFTNSDKYFARRQTSSEDSIRYHIKKVYPKIQTLKVSGPFRIILTNGAINILTIYANDNILKEINTKLKEETLTINLTGKIKISADTPIKIMLQSNDINSIFLKDTTNLTAENLNKENLNLHATDKSIATISGNVTNLNLKIHSFAKLNAAQLIANNIIIDANGHTDTIINPQKKLDMIATNQAKITYFSTPEIINKVSKGDNKIIKN